MTEAFSIFLVSPALWLTSTALDIFFLSEPAAVLNFWLWQFFGRLHPMIVHFPIALLIIALMMEFFAWKGKTTEVRRSIHILLVVGAVSALVAVLFGLSLKTQDQYSGELIVIHQWTGIATAVLATATAFLHRILVGSGKVFFLRWYRAALIFTVLAVTLAGHYGASLTHGADFLTAVLPWHNGDLPESNFDIAEFTSGKGGPLTDKQIADLNLEVRTIFAHNCYKCHSSAKIKGELRLDKRKFVMKGGKSGDVISAGHPEKSELIRRLLLP
ncbi:MAG TPA: c-type cytochrome domain-containing protein, partial [Chryseosolibacter sp.]|nr:c-type cytochrome domain-containing protein [Chryseosolibacter sp.]